MIQLLLLCAWGILCTVSEASARSEYRIGGAAGNPWQAPLSLEQAGSYLVFDGNGQELRQMPVGVTPHGAGTDTLIDFSGTSIHPRFIDPAVNMALTDPESSEIKIPLLYTGGQASTTNSCSAADDQIRAVKKQFDGDLTTAHFRLFTQDPEAPPGHGSGWGALSRLGPQAVVMDFGAAVPVNRIRFYPRLDREDDILLIQEFADPRPPREAFGEDSFIENFLAWYEIRLGDNSAAFRQGPCDKVGEAKGLPWVSASDSQLKILKSTRENLAVVVDLRFPTQSVRWLTMRPMPLRDWEVAEFEVYGEGFAVYTVFLTQILDFDQPVNWGKIRWSGEVPEGTRVEIRTRTGETPDPNLYFAEQTNGEIRPITLDQYQKIDPTGRLPTAYDADNWSFWSPPYDFAAGLRDGSLPVETWKDGTPLLSPGPSRYIQIAVRLFATFKAAPRLDQLTLQFNEAPSAREVLGEIWPSEVTSFEPTTFTYVVRPDFQRSDVGFDRLEILTPSRVDTLRSVKVDGAEIDRSLYPPEVLDDRLVMAFPPLVGEEDSFKQLKVVFDTVVLRYGTEFSGWVFNSADPDQIKQRVRPGNATFQFSGDVLAVKTPIGGDLLVEVDISSRPFTPNGDGVNDNLIISYKLREVAVERAVSLRIYDLAGTLVRKLPSLSSRSGEFRHEWDGRNTAGRLVSPGAYLYRLSLHAGENENKIGILSVVY